MTLFFLQFRNELHKLIARSARTWVCRVSGSRNPDPFLLNLPSPRPTSGG